MGATCASSLLVLFLPYTFQFSCLVVEVKATNRCSVGINVGRCGPILRRNELRVSTRQGLDLSVRQVKPQGIRMGKGKGEGRVGRKEGRKGYSKIRDGYAEGSLDRKDWESPFFWLSDDINVSTPSIYHDR